MLSPGPSHAALSSAAPAFWASEADTHFGAEYGYFHAANRNAEAYLPDLLLVFVHGINSDPMGCWGDLPPRVLQDTEFDIDILNFRFPAGFLRKTLCAPSSCCPPLRSWCASLRKASITSGGMQSGHN